MRFFVAKLVFFLLAMAYFHVCWGQTVYKCETEEGTTFSQQPCAEDAKIVRSRGQSGGVDEFDDEHPEEVVGGSRAEAFDGPVVKSLRRQVMDKSVKTFSTLKAATITELEKCGKVIDEEGNVWYISCED